MAVVDKYRYYCNTGSTYVYEWRDSGDIPTQCKNDPSHSIDTSSITIVEFAGDAADVTTDGQLKVAIEPTPGLEKYFFSPNVCDETTWYEGSVQVTNQALTDSGDLTTWTSPDVNWIDLVHGKVLDEDFLTGADATLMEVVEVSTDGGTVWTTKTRNSWGTSDGDYDVDYAAGSITFNTALQSGDLVRATYRKASDFQFTVTPDAGKRLKVSYVEVQFSRDVQITGAAVFQIKVYDPANLPNKMVYIQRVYKTLNDFYAESTGPFPPVMPQGKWVVEEAVGVSAIQTKVQAGYEIKGTYYDSAGSTWRALVQGIDPTDDRTIRRDILTIPFKYGAFRDLKDSQGAEIVVTLQNGVFGGEYGSFTFYCFSEDE